MDRGQFRKKVFLDLLTAPWTLLPTVAGFSALLGSWALSQPPEWLTFAGIAGVLAGVGGLLSRWFLSSDAIAKKAFDQLQDEQFASEKAKLDQLDARLQRDEDPRTEESLRTLRSLYDDFQADPEWLAGMGAKTAFEIANNVEKLFNESIISLERALELWQVAQKMRTKSGRKSLFESREQILGEIEENIKQLARTLDGLRALEVKSRSDERLARIRTELAESLDVAYRVDERLQSLESELEHGGAREHE